MANVATISQLIKTNLSDFALASHCFVACADKDFKKQLFYNDIDTVLNFDFITDFITTDQINILAAFAGVLTNFNNPLYERGVVAGNTILTTYPSLPLSSASVQPALRHGL